MATVPSASSPEMSALEADLGDRVTDTLVASELARQAKADVTPLRDEVVAQECELLGQLARQAQPVFEDLPLYEPDDEWVPAETVVPAGRGRHQTERTVPTPAVGRKWIAFQVGAPQTVSDGYLYPVRGMVMTADGRMEVVASMGQSGTNDPRTPGTWYGAEMEELEDLERADDATLAEHETHYLAEWTPEVARLGTEFDTGRLLDAIRATLERPAEKLTADRRTLEVRERRVQGSGLHR